VSAGRVLVHEEEPVEKWAQVAIVIELGIIALAYLVGLFRRP
jgi:hypothetical protein